MRRDSLFARGRARLALRRCDKVGDDVRLDGWPSIENRGTMEVGDGVVISSSPVAAHLATGTEGTLLIGARVTIGHGSSIVAEGLITIAEGTTIGPFAIICDADEDGIDGWTRSRRPIVIGHGAHIGTKVVVLPGTFIADGCVVPGGSIASGVVTAGFDDAQPLAITGGDGAPAADAARQLARILAKVFDRSADAPPGLELERISGWSAGGALRLLLAVEREFKATIHDDEWLALRTVADLRALVERRSGAAVSRSVPVERAGPVR